MSSPTEQMLVSASSFSHSYEPDGPGLYRKVAPVWAFVADTDGVVPSEEGSTRYEAGDYVVFQSPEHELGWAMGPDEFTRTYEPAED